MRKKNKLAAFTLLAIHGLSVFYPGVSYALTNGPKAPESSQFQPASISNLVDPFSGDFSYNIPLLDVDGYPVNIAYSSGGSMDDEASWVGYGWNINPGSVSRVMKGIPDDFNGTDKITKDYNIRPDITGGIAFNASLEIFGLDFLGANANVDIFYNNHRGIGVEIGAGISATLSTAKHVSGDKTGGLSAGLNLGIQSNSQTGADFNFGLSVGTSIKNTEGDCGSAGLRFGGSLNSRAGLKSTTLSASFNTSKGESDKEAQARKEYNDNPDNVNKRFAGGHGSAGIWSGSATTSYGQAYSPTITMPMTNESYSLSPQLGLEFWGLQLFLQATAHYTRQKLATSHKEFPAYGFLHGNKAKNDPDALQDFNREKDVPYMDNTPTLAVPYVTQDVFTATSQMGSSQFKAFSNGSGVFFDNYGSNVSNAFALGIEFGAGGGIKAGGDLSFNGSNTVTKKWNGNNDFLQNGDFNPSTATDGEDTYFKLVGEQSSANRDYLAKIADREPVRIKTGAVSDDAKAFSVLESNNRTYPVTSKIQRNIREPKGEIFTPLSADKAAKFGLDKTIKNYAVATTSSAVTCSSGVFGSCSPIQRVGGTHKGHHFSEITVTKNDGMRLVYGVPVYNNEQTDVTFNVGDEDGGTNNLVNYSAEDNSVKNKKGRDFYFSKENVPAYATNFLLSGVASPDYVDITGNGISDDDLGSAVKFNYSLVNDAYKWRTPTAAGSNYANFNKGFISDKKDNKASLSYGTKELWYTNSIESKNMIAVFRVSDRKDGFGFNPDGTVDPNSKQKELDRIDLYTKAELLNNPTNPVPVKSVHFEYDYSLFPGVANYYPANLSKGKLTLKSIYFTYGKSNSGAENRYYFKYNPSGNFEYQQYDRWGNYKSKSVNTSIAGVDLDNNDFPYSVQDQAKADEGVIKWQLNEIELPSGGKIQISYESDDYAFVQDRRAMQMAKIVGYGSLNGIGNAQNFKDYQETDNVFIQLPASTTPDKLKWQYFEGVDQLYFKTMIDLDDNGSTELVSGYAKILNVKLVDEYGADIPTTPSGQTGHIAKVTLEKRGGYHPVAAAAWQFMRTNLPQLAYKYSVNEDLSPLGFVKALIAAIGNVSELLTPFEHKAMRLHFASKIIPGKGYARIDNNFRKFGGGLRVKQIIMDDIWAQMAGSGNGSSTHTGMIFEYKKKYRAPDGNEIEISSGVASYEPMTGSEENPFKQPIPYQQKQHLTSNLYTVDEPVGESYFPSPSVGYSQVTIKNLDATGAVVNNGYSFKKFYTAKDFPTVVKRTDLSKTRYNQTSIFGLFNIDQGNSVVLSQGFFVETNDMHGKPLSDETFDGTGKLLSGSYYHYKSKGTEQLALDNNALTLHPDGTVQNDLIGEEFEMFHDMRQQVTDNIGVSLNLNLDVLFLTIFTVPIPTFIPIVQSSYSGYQAASTIKVINHYAIADKVTTIENGSTMTSENVLWDALTGQVLLTKTQNGFDDPVYNFTLPAYMVNEYEKGMGAGYRNTGIIFNSVTLNSNGQVPASIKDFLVPGDELGVINSASGERVWVMDADITAAEDLRFIKKDGSIYGSNPGNSTSNLVVLRSGRRNLMGASTYSVVSLKNPISNGHINIGQPTEILSTSAGTFSDEWTAAAQYISCANPLVGGTGGTGDGGKVNTMNKVLADNNPNKDFKRISIDDLVNAKRSGNTSNTTCDGCSDLNDYSITYVPGPPNTTCVRIKYNCLNLIPENTRVVFNLESSNYSSNSFGVVELTRSNPDQVICLPGGSGYQMFLGAWYCITKNTNCGDVCANLSNAFDIKTSWYNGGAVGLPGNICGDPHYGNVVVRYNCTTPFPANTIVRFTFSTSCSSNTLVQSVDLTSSNPDGVVCFPHPPVTVGCPPVTLVSAECISTGGGCCPNPINQKFNPYYTGLKGNWRGKESYVYTTERDPRIDPGNAAKLPTNTRKGGIFSAFNSFYVVQNGKFVRQPVTDVRWVASATVTKVNNKGQEVENMDALHKYSAAQFGFNELVATAVSSNARHNEIGYDGFEDYAYNTSCNGTTQNCNEDGHFNFKKQLGIANGSGFALSTAAAHTGNYSVMVSPGIGNNNGGIAFTNRKTVNTLDDPALRYDFNSNKEMILKEGGFLSDFRPMVGKKYVISGWIKGDVASEADPANAGKAKIIVEGFAGTVSSGYTAIAVKAGPKVEGWTRVMATFELPTGANIDNVTVRLAGGGAVAYFDDIRIHPYDGNMKSFAYDYRTSRLMAELDENNYATFYEYDDEGQLLRNKKETEKGIVTLKETRSRVRKNQQ